jgi:molybdopterin-guanine dinucleotide biosynthesis protein A
VTLHVIITAGGEMPRELQHASDSLVKALLRIGERTLLEQAVSAAAESKLAGNIVVVGNDDVLRANPAAASYAEAGKTAVENLHRGFLHHGGSMEDEFFVLSPDLPFITSASIDEFLTHARAASDFAFPLVTAEDFQALFPGSLNRFELLDGRRVTMGSCFYITGRMLHTNIPLFNDFFRCRRAPHKLAAMLGLPIALSYLLGRARVEQLEARACQLTGGTVRAIQVRDASLAFDIDKVRDYEYALGRVKEE